MNILRKGMTQTGGLLLMRNISRLEVAEGLELELEKVDLDSRQSLLDFDQNYESVLAHLENIKFIPRTLD